MFSFCMGVFLEYMQCGYSKFYDPHRSVYIREIWKFYDPRRSVYIRINLVAFQYPFAQRSVYIRANIVDKFITMQ